MGKALIISHSGEGLYKAKLQPDRSAYDRHHARLVENIAKVTDMLAALALQISDAESFENGANEELQNAIVNQSANLPTLEKEWLETLNTLQGLYQTRSRLTLQRAALQLSLDELEKSAPQDAAEVDLWCADYSEDLSGTVGTIEPAGDPSLGIILRPGQRNPAWNPQGDGTLRDTRHMSAAEVFWNAAMLPGWQKWTPTYRIGTITALNGDSCDVTLEAVQSDAKGLNVNQSGTLTGVGVDYMDCHGAAFEVGDTVVVMFQGQEWANPQVIGFEANPKPCFTRGLQINNSGVRKFLKWEDPEWKATVSTSGMFGNIDWRGVDGTVLSWRGVPSRYWNWDGTNTNDQCGRITGTPVSNGYYDVYTPIQHITSVDGVTETFFNATIYNGLKKITVAPQGIPLTRIAGAAINGDKMVIVGSRGGTFEFIGFADSDGKNQRGFTSLIRIAEADLPIGPVEVPYLYDLTPWFFSASGTKGVATRQVRTEANPNTIETHKMTLDIDFSNETYTLTDHGQCSMNTETTEITLYDVTSNPSIYNSQVATVTTETISSVFDFIGEVETELLISHKITALGEAILPIGAPNYSSIPVIRKQLETVTNSFVVDIGSDRIIDENGSSKNGWEAEFFNEFDGDALYRYEINGIYDNYITLYRIEYADIRTKNILYFTDKKFIYNESYWESPPPTLLIVFGSYDYSRISATITNISGRRYELQETFNGHYEEKLIYDEIHMTIAEDSTTIVNARPSSGTSPGSFNISILDNYPVTLTSYPRHFSSIAVAGISNFDVNGKKVICLKKNTSIVPAGEIYSYMDDGDLSEFATLPCNPICAV